MTRTHTITVAKDQSGQRLDKWLAEALPQMSRSRLKALIEQGQVSGDGETLSEPSARVKQGWRVTVIEPEATPAEPEAQAMDLDIIYEDDDLLVLDKPAGLVVHPASGSPDHTLVNALLAHCGDSLSGIGGVKRPGIVHRLDKDTSGLMVVAKNDAAHKSLAAQFEARTIERTYQAIVWGVPSPSVGKVEGNIGRDPRNRKKMAVVEKGGKPALTRYRVLKILAGGAASLIECKLATGRTHQIRVHMTALGHPLIGDPLYGKTTSGRLKSLPEGALQAVKAFRRQALHALVIGFIHPKTADFMSYKGTLSNDFNALLCELDVV